VLVLASTRELALQIHESFPWLRGVCGCAIGGGLRRGGNAAADSASGTVQTSLWRLRRYLLDLMQQGCAGMDGLQVLVLDGANRCWIWDFLPAIQHMLQRIPKQRQTLLFSATMWPEIRELAQTIFADPVNIFD
jgi:ATP-dependent RNA helicase RhlE